MVKKIAIITTHPIQYNAPLFSQLANDSAIDLKVFYTWGESAMTAKYDPDFKRVVEWDIPLLNHYNFTFVKNTSSHPGSHHFRGIVNPTLNLEIQEWGADIIWVWGWSFYSHLKAMLFFKGKIPVWFRGDSTLLDEPIGINLKKALRFLFLKWVFKHIDKAFYVGLNNKKYFIKFGVYESKLIYAPHAIDNVRFQKNEASLCQLAKDWKKQLGIDNDKRVILFVGKFESKKNPFYFIDLLSELSHFSYVGIMIGSGPLEEKLKKSATSNVYFLPFQNQSKMPIVYRLGDILVLPSRGPGETWGLVMNEALASGLQVYASGKCGGAIDLIDDYFIFNTNDSIKILVDKIIKNTSNYKNKNIGTYTNIVNAVKLNL
jgi:glycosyltransferase involved in cell wall biosynthesis